MIEAVFFAAIFLLSVLCVYIFSQINKKNGIVGNDINKRGQPPIPEAGGMGLILPLWIAVIAIMAIFFSGFNRFYFIFGLTVTGFCAMGLLDDTKQKFKMKTIPWIFRAIPIVFISLLFGVVHWWSFGAMPAILIAAFLAVLGSLENTFAGLNGWEIGSGFIISLFVTLVVLNGNDPALVLLAGSLNAMVLGLLFWNRFPARVFPGDSGTLFIGAAIAAILVMNQRMEMILLGLLFFLPHLVDFFLLKLLTNPKDVSQSTALPYALLPDNRLSLPKTGNGTKLDFAKLLLKVFGPMKEWQIVAVIWAIVFGNCLFWSLVFGII